MRVTRSSALGSHWRREIQGYVRVIAAQPGYERLVQRAFEKIRQASQGMPAVMIRQLETLAKMMTETTDAGQRRFEAVLTAETALVRREAAA